MGLQSGLINYYEHCEKQMTEHPHRGIWLCEVCGIAKESLDVVKKNSIIREDRFRDRMTVDEVWLEYLSNRTPTA